MKLSDKPILLVENNLSDIENISKALKAIKFECPLINMNTFEEASTYLKNRKNVQPRLILLGLDGQKSERLSFLKAIKANENIRQIPVIIFASPNEQCDIVKSFELGVAGYIVKSRDISQMTDKFKTIIQYWTLSELPSAGG